MRLSTAGLALAAIASSATAQSPSPKRLATAAPTIAGIRGHRDEALEVALKHIDSVEAPSLRGKRVRISGYVKSRDGGNCWQERRRLDR